MAPLPFSRQSTCNNNDDDDEPEIAEAVVVVTPYSTGCCVAREIQSRGYKVICLWSHGFSEIMKTHVPLSCRDCLKYDLVLDEQPTVADTAAMVLDETRRLDMQVVAVVCGGEAGVDLADALSEEMHLLTNGTEVPNRRDKKVQQELVKAAGLRSIRQAAGSEFSQVEEFLKNEQYPVIVKPDDSAGSDGVKLCHTFEDAKTHFHELMEVHDMVNGGKCHEVLCQEFLKGREYVVDHCSRDGIHKCVMTWVYDKGPANGAAFVYFGDIPIDSESPEAKVLIPYVRGVLDALGIKNGPTHAEVIITEEGGPCLVEMNCRANGGDGVWEPLCRALTGGYNQVDAAVDAYLSKEQFERLPDRPPSPFKAAGQCVDLVSYTAGTVKSTPGYNIIKLLPSFVCLQSHIKPGSKVVPTIDLATDIGAAILMHPSKDVLERDIALIRQMEQNNVMFEFESDEKTPPRPTTRPRSSSMGNSKPPLPPSPMLSRHRPHRRMISMTDNPGIYNY